MVHGLTQRDSGRKKILTSQDQVSDSDTYATPSRWRRWRDQRLLDRYNDAEHHLREWAFGMTPSERRKAQAKMDRLAVKTACLRFHRGEPCDLGRNHPVVDR